MQRVIGLGNAQGPREERAFGEEGKLHVSIPTNARGFVGVIYSADDAGVSK